ncbi:hypothetical protein ACIA8K_40655 [Catenuloplanes sp. NPDC051500]
MSNRRRIEPGEALLYYRLLMSGDPLDEVAAHRAADAAAAAAQAGVYR